MLGFIGIGRYREASRCIMIKDVGFDRESCALSDDRSFQSLRVRSLWGRQGRALVNIAETKDVKV